VLVFSAETHREFLRRYADYTQARFESSEREGPPNVAQVLKSERGRRARRGLRERLVRELGLADLLRRPVHLLSHGESRKVFLARLLLRSPRLLLLDDPFVGLDTRTRVALGQALEGILRDGNPQLIFFTSRPEEIPAGIDHVAVLENCRLVAAGLRVSAPIPVEGTEPWMERDAHARDAFTRAAAHYEETLNRALGPAPDEVIRMRGVTVRYGDTTALDGVDWTMRAGERWALLGPNGAGKTTLLSLVLGDHPQAYANDVWLFGRRRGSGESIWEIKARVGWVSPELQIHFPRAMNCLDVACSGYFDSIGLFRRPTEEQVERARGWLLALEAPPAPAPFNELSAGQQRLVLLARALVKHPPLLVLDEALQGLDSVYRRRFVSLIDELCHHSSLSLIYVSHYADEIPACVTRKIWLDQGKVKQIE
jgi:molybdate transport system ATP-binding protein